MDRRRAVLQYLQRRQPERAGFEEEVDLRRDEQRVRRPDAGEVAPRVDGERRERRRPRRRSRGRRTACRAPRCGGSRRRSRRWSSGRARARSRSARPGARARLRGPGRPSGSRSCPRCAGTPTSCAPSTAGATSRSARANSSGSTWTAAPVRAPTLAARSADAASVTSTRASTPRTQCASSSTPRRGPSGATGRFHSAPATVSAIALGLATSNAGTTAPSSDADRLEPTRRATRACDELVARPPRRRVDLYGRARVDAGEELLAPGTGAIDARHRDQSDRSGRSVAPV